MAAATIAASTAATVIALAALTHTDHTHTVVFCVSYGWLDDDNKMYLFPCMEPHKETCGKQNPTSMQTLLLIATRYVNNWLAAGSVNIPCNN